MTGSYVYTYAFSFMQSLDDVFHLLFEYPYNHYSSLYDPAFSMPGDLSCHVWLSTIMSS